MSSLDHPNIVKYLETYDDDKYIYLIMEYIPGCQLFHKIVSQPNKVFGEKQAAEYLR